MDWGPKHIWMLALASSLFLVLACRQNIPGAPATTRASPTSAASTLPPSNTISVRPSVTAAVESEPMPNEGDAADDPAIWVHPSRPDLSTVIVTDKKGGLAVYNLTGKQLQYLPLGRMNNVDLRDDFPLGSQRVTLVAANNRDTNAIVLLRVDPATRTLVDITAQPRETRGTYGSCMYHSAATDDFYYFVTDHDGTVEQWRLFDSGEGKVDANKVRTLKLDSQTEGCVADDELGHLYIAEEDAGIWKFGAEPTTGTTRTMVDRTGPNGHLTAEVEGLAIAYGTNRDGILIASSQGNNRFAVYGRDGKNAYIGSFSIVDGHAVDGVNDTDGIDVTSANLGPAFPQGVFIAQDGSNGNQNQNVKLVPLQAIIGKQRVATPATP